MKIYYHIILLFFLLFPSPIFAQNIEMPFLVQTAGFGWWEPWKSACEETSITIIDYYYNNKELILKNARADILWLVKKENQILKKNQDTNLDETAKMINLFYSWEARIVENPSLRDIKIELDAGRPILIPVHGPLLQNKYYGKNLDAHMFVLSGYDDNTQEFIVQEVGMKKGHDFRYSYKILMDAMHEYVPGRKTQLGRKAVLFTSRELYESDLTDGDKDGLSKVGELAAYTSLRRADTDDDKYSDGVEVKNNYSPLVAEFKINKVFIKTAHEPTIFFLEKFKKQEVADRSNHSVIIVSDKFMSKLQNK